MADIHSLVGGRLTTLAEEFIQIIPGNWLWIYIWAKYVFAVSGFGVCVPTTTTIHKQQQQTI